MPHGEPVAVIAHSYGTKNDMGGFLDRRSNAHGRVCSCTARPAWQLGYQRV